MRWGHAQIGGVRLGNPGVLDAEFLAEEFDLLLELVVIGGEPGSGVDAVGVKPHRFVRGPYGTEIGGPARPACVSKLNPLCDCPGSHCVLAGVLLAVGVYSSP